MKGKDWPLLFENHRPQWFSISLVLLPSVQFLRLWWPPSQKTIPLLRHHCNFATITNCKYPICRIFVTPKRVTTHKWKPLIESLFQVGDSWTQSSTREAASALPLSLGCSIQMLQEAFVARLLTPCSPSHSLLVCFPPWPLHHCLCFQCSSFGSVIDGWLEYFLSFWIWSSKPYGVLLCLV